MRTFRRSISWPATLAFLLSFGLACGPTAGPTSGGGNPPPTQTPNSAGPINIVTFMAPQTPMTQSADRGTQIPLNVDPTTGATGSGITPSVPAPGILTSTPNTPTQSSPAPTPLAQASEAPIESPHASLYEFINETRAAVSRFPLIPDSDLENVAQIHAERGAWNTGLSIEPLLFERNLRCREFTVLSTGYPRLNPPEDRDRLMATAELYDPDFAAFAAAHEDKVNHLLWWLQWPEWDILISADYTHVGYGATVIPKMSLPGRSHPGVLVFCEK